MTTISKKIILLKKRKQDDEPSVEANAEVPTEDTEETSESESSILDAPIAAIKDIYRLGIASAKLGAMCVGAGIVLYVGLSVLREGFKVLANIIPA